MKSIIKLDLVKLVPTTKIESIIGEKLTVHLYENLDIEKYKEGALQQALEFSMNVLYFKKKIPCLPTKLFPLRGSSRFVGPATSFLKSQQADISTNQKMLVLKNKNDFSICELHLADLIENQWMICDILLQLPEPISDNPIRALFKGIGHGVFDEILTNVQVAALESKIKNICIMAFTRAHLDIFSKRGYSKIEWNIGDNGQRDISFPMRLPLKQ